MFNRWATGLRSGLLLEGFGFATAEVEVFARVLIFGRRGLFFPGFWEVLGSLPHLFYRG